MFLRPMAVAILLAATAVGATAQTHVRLGVGLTGSTALVRDSIVRPVTARPAFAPTVSLAIGRRLDTGYRIGLGLAVARSTVRQHANDEIHDIVTLTVWQPTIHVGRAIGPVELGARGGVEIYRAAQPVGLFRDGGATSMAVGGDVAWPGVSIAGGRVGLAADWTVSRFSTATLRLFGFRGTQTVHRVGIRVLITGGRHAP